MKTQIKRHRNENFKKLITLGKTGNKSKEQNGLTIMAKRECVPWRVNWHKKNRWLKYQVVTKWPVIT